MVLKREKNNECQNKKVDYLILGKKEPARKAVGITLTSIN